MSDHQILDFDAQPFSHMDSPMRTVVTGFKDNTPTVYCNARSLMWVNNNPNNINTTTTSNNNNNNNNTEDLYGAVSTEYLTALYNIKS